MKMINLGRSRRGSVAGIPLLILLGLASRVFPAPPVQEEPEFAHPARHEVHETVKSAKVEAEVIVRRGSDRGAVVIRRIRPPAQSKQSRLRRQVQRPSSEKENELAVELKRLAVENPVTVKWFIPSIEVYESGVSLVRWQSPDQDGEWGGFEAWVALDLSTIRGCGSFQVGETAYDMLALTIDARSRRLVPEKGELVEKYRLTKGDSENEEALEPLLAIIQLYEQDGDDIAAVYEAIEARKAAWQKWKRENPAPVRDTEISFWPIQSTEYPTEPSR